MKRGRKRAGRRVRLTHLEVRRGGAIRLRLAIADDAVAEVGDEVGALLKKIAPGTRTRIILPSEVAAADLPPDASPDAPPEFVISPTHGDDDEAYHAGLRSTLAELFSVLCDTALADALEIAKRESDRRVDGVN